MDILLTTIILIILTFIPTLELRFSIPVGILAGSLTLPFFGVVNGFGLPWWYVFIVCVLANILLAALFYWFLHVVVKRLLLHWPWFRRFYTKRVEKAQQRIHKHVERWGWFGLAVFIGIPLPGSGVYTGALAAYAVGMSKERFMAASVLGVLIAGILVTLFSLGIVQVIGFF